MERVRLNIDGNEVTALEGSTVLQAAQASGIRIPTLCAHPALTPYGACRLCVVEEVERRALLAACVTPVREGLHVLTASKKVLAARREILGLLMASHPESCIVCDRGNRCQLRGLAAEAGLGIPDLYRIPYVPPAADHNAVLARDMARCVVCGRCIRADHEVVARGAIDYTHRGFEARPAPVLDTGIETSDCTLCGTCEAVCPTGAIYEVRRPLVSHAAQLTPTTCWLCGCGCAVHAASSSTMVVGIQPDPDRSSAGIALCVRGHYGYEHLNARDRLKTPLIRQGGALVGASWEEALEVAADGLLQTVRAAGPRACGVIGGSKSTNEEAYLLQRLTRCALRTANIDSAARLDAAGVLESLAEATGWPGGSCTLADLDRADFVLLLGADPDTEAPAVAYAIRRAMRQRGCRVVAVGAMRPHLASLGARFIPAVGIQLAGVAAHLMVALLELGHDPSEVLSAKVPDEFWALARSWRSQASDADASDLDELAGVLARASRACVVCGRQVAAGPAAGDAARWVVDLALFAGAKLMALSAEPNAHGAIQMGIAPGLLPSGVKVGSEAAKTFEQTWGVELPKTPGLAYPQMLAAARRRELKALLLVGENPLRALPGTAVVMEGLRSVDHLVVVEPYLSESAKQASVVLPAAAATERAGTWTSIEGRVQPIQPVVPPPGEAKPELWILSQLSNRLGVAAPAQPVALAAEMHRLVPRFGPAAKAGTWLHPGADVRRLLTPGPPPKPGGAGAPRGVTLRLVVTAALEHAGSGTRTSRSHKLCCLAPGPLLRINPEDAAQAHLERGRLVVLSVEDAEIELRFQEDPAVPARTVAVTQWPELMRVMPFVIDPSGHGPRTLVDGVEIRPGGAVTVSKE